MEVYVLDFIPCHPDKPDSEDLCNALGVQTDTSLENYGPQGPKYNGCNYLEVKMIIMGGTIGPNWVS